MSETHQPIVFADLSKAQKEAFYNFFIEQEVKFSPDDASGGYVAHIRMVPPGSGSSGSGSGGAIADGSGSTRRAPASSLRRVTPTAESTAAAQELSGLYPMLCIKIATPPGELAAKESARAPRGLPWLMRTIEDVYDARFIFDQTAFDNDDVGSGAAHAAVADEVENKIFPTFVYNYFTKKYGLRSLVDENCWGMLSAVHDLRNDRLELQIFARFLEEEYDADDLLFFLYVRSIVQKETGISFQSRWSEGAGRHPRESLWLSYRACLVVSRTVFMSEKDELYIKFMRQLDEHFIGDVKESGDKRRVEFSKFLYLALTEYHNCRPEAGSSAPPPPQQQQQQYVASPQPQGDSQQAYFAAAEQQYDQSLAASAAASAAVVAGQKVMLSDLHRTMSEAASQYLEAVMRPIAERQLAQSTLDAAKDELSRFLSSEVNAILDAVVNASSAQPPAGSMGDLVRTFQFLYSTGSNEEAALIRFCSAVLAQGSVSQGCQRIAASIAAPPAAAPSSSAAPSVHVSRHGSISINR